MTKLTVDDLVVAQQRTETALQEIATLLKPKKKTGFVFELTGILSLVFWLFGLWLTYQGNLAGICVSMIAISSRIERLLSK